VAVQRVVVNGKNCLRRPLMRGGVYERWVCLVVRVKGGRVFGRKRGGRGGSVMVGPEGRFRRADRGKLG